MFSCSQCSFTAQFQSALMMHRQLHHPAAPAPPPLDPDKKKMRRLSPPSSPVFRNKNKTLGLLPRTSSATKLLGKIKARICKSRTLFAHPEVPELTMLSPRSECTSKLPKVDSSLSISSPTPASGEAKETFACHMCSFDADRITTLDRHLLNHHKIGLENLLKLVMAKTKDGLSDERTSAIFGIRQPYYRSQNEIIEEGEFIIETVTPQIKILKHASTNTEDSKEMALEKNCEMLYKEIENLIGGEKSLDLLKGEKSLENEDFMTKMQTLNECMCRFVTSTNALKKVLTKEMDSKVNVKERYNSGEPFYDMVLGGSDAPRNWQRSHSERMERTRNKYSDAASRPDKLKPSSESFYY